MRSWFFHEAKWWQFWWPQSGFTGGLVGGAIGALVLGVSAATALLTMTK